MQTVPLTNDARQTFLTTIDGLRVRVTAWYQAIGPGWYVNIDLSNVRILSGAKVNSKALVLGALLSDLDGDFMALPITRPEIELSRNPWSESHLFVYLTREELVELNASII